MPPDDPHSADTCRLFVALPLADASRDKLQNLVAALKSRLKAGRDMRWSSPSQWHITLRFLGNVPRAVIPDLIQAQREVARVAAPLHLKLTGLGTFPSPARPRVLWAGLAGDTEPLCQLQAHLQDKTAAWGKKEDRPFRPHLTLARLRTAPKPLSRALDQCLQDRAGQVVTSWTVSQMQLMQSELSETGAVYTVLESSNLGPGPG